MAQIVDATTRDRAASAEDDHAPPVERGWGLVVVHHPRRELAGERLVLTPGTEISIGRTSQVFGAGVLDDLDLSRKHVHFKARKDGLILIDKSKNGTDVNGERCPRGADVLLRDGDVVSVATSAGPILLLARFMPTDYVVRQHGRILGRSHLIAEVLEKIEHLGPTDLPVLIGGESGSGKELVARALHDASHRADKAYIAVSSRQVSELVLQSELFGHVRGAFTGAERNRAGLLDAASGGTLFLDEIGDASMELQLSLFRVLEDKVVRPVGADTGHSVDVRIVMASDASFEDLVQTGTFRRQLYNRISGHTIRLPALRERLEDVLLLSEHFVEECDPRRRPIHPDLALALLRHPWPGNVRELRSLIKDAVAFAADEPGIALSARIAEKLADGRRMAEAVSRDRGALAPSQQRLDEDAAKRRPAAPRRAKVPSKEQLLELLDVFKGNKKAIAENLGVTRQAVYDALKKHGIFKQRDS